MTKVKVSVKKQTTEDVEIELPYYFKLKFGTYSMCYAVSENGTITFDDSGPNICCYNSQLLDSIGDINAVEITREEFENKYYEAIAKLNLIVKEEVSTNELKAA